jgi:hypothetical protein
MCYARAGKQWFSLFVCRQCQHLLPLAQCPAGMYGETCSNLNHPGLPDLRSNPKDVAACPLRTLLNSTAIGLSPKGFWRSQNKGALFVTRSRRHALRPWLW